jgi:hypothetical protein
MSRPSANPNKLNALCLIARRKACPLEAGRRKRITVRQRSVAARARINVEYAVLDAHAQRLEIAQRSVHLARQRVAARAELGFRRIARFERRAPAARKGVGHSAIRLGGTQAAARQLARAAKKGEIEGLPDLPRQPDVAAGRRIIADCGLLPEAQTRLLVGEPRLRNASDRQRRRNQRDGRNRESERIPHVQAVVGVIGHAQLRFAHPDIGVILPDFPNRSANL